LSGFEYIFEWDLRKATTNPGQGQDAGKRAASR